MDRIPNTSGIYAIRNLINGHIYVGSAVNLRRRYHQHFGSLKRRDHKNPHLQAAVDLYGIESFEFSSIELIHDKHKLLEREQHYMDLLKPEYNIKPRAENNLGHRWSKESRKRFSEYHKNNPITPERRAAMIAALRSEEVRRKNSESHKGKKLTGEHKRNFVEAGRKATLGRKVSEETRQKWSILRKGKKLPPASEERKRKISEANSGRPLSEEHRAKLSTAWIGRKQKPEYQEFIGGLRERNLGKKRSDETKAKMRAARLGKVQSQEHKDKIAKGRELAKLAREQDRLAKERELLARWEGAASPEPINSSEYKPLTLWDDTDFAS